jgi:hypothetical protein
VHRDEERNVNFSRGERFVVVFAAAVSAVASDRFPEAVAKGRDLRSYEYGGVYRTPVNLRELTDIQRLRQFVLTHWTQKRRGYVEFVFRVPMQEVSTTSSSSQLVIIGV